MKKPTRRQLAKALVAKPRVFPAHLSSTSAEWRALKRQEWREVMAALNRYGYGAAYAPAGAELYKLQHLATQIEEQLAPDDWVAW